MFKKIASLVTITALCLQIVMVMPASAKVVTARQDFSYGGAANGSSILTAGDTASGFDTGWCTGTAGTALSTTRATLETVDSQRGMQLAPDKAVVADKVYRKINAANTIYPTLNADRTTYVQWKQRMDSASGITPNSWQRIDFYTTGETLVFTAGAFIPQAGTTDAYYPGIKWTKGTVQEAYDYTTPITRGETYNIIVMVKAASASGQDVLSMKVWPVGQPEPLKWNATITVTSTDTPAWIAFDSYNPTKPFYADFKVDAYVDVVTPPDSERTKINTAETSLGQCIAAINSGTLTKTLVDDASTAVGLVPSIGTGSQTLAAASMANRRRILKAFYDADSFKWSDISATQSQDSVTQDLTLPTNSAVGTAYSSAIRWSSSNTSALQISGNKAIVSPVSTTTIVDLILTADLAGTIQTKKFTIILPRTNTAYYIASNAAQDALSGNYNSIAKAIKSMNSLADPTEREAIKFKLSQIPVSFYVGAYVLKSGNFALSKFFNQNITCQMSVINNTAGPVTITPIFALFQGNKMIKMDASAANAFAVSSKDVVTVNLDVPFAMPTGSTLKIFSWDGLSNITPLYASGKADENGFFSGDSILQDNTNPYKYDGIFQDDCSSMNLQNARTQNLESKLKTGENLSLLYNDNHTISRLIDKNEWLEWKVTNAKEAVFTTYYSSAMPQGCDFKIYASTDGNNYQVVSTSRTDTYFVGKWYKYDYKAALPDGTNYIRVEFPVMNDGLVYNPQLGNVMIYYDKEELAGVPVDIASTDYTFRNYVTQLINKGVLDNTTQYSETQSVTAGEFVQFAYAVSGDYLSTLETNQILSSKGVSASDSLTRSFAASVLADVFAGGVTPSMEPYRSVLKDITDNDSVLEVFCKGIMTNDQDGNFNPNEVLDFGNTAEILYKAVNVDSLAPVTQNSIALSSVFSDNMVLQRDKNIKVWGDGTINGEPVTVTLNNQTLQATVVDGKWEVEFSPMAAETSCQLVVSGLNTTLTYNNVGLGDVYFCSGQSNMKWRLQDSDNAAEEIAAANYPNIRLFTQTAVFASESKNTPNNGAWNACSSTNVGDFSAVAYYFVKELSKTLSDVPIGLVSSSVGGSAIEQWMTSGASNLPNFVYRAEYPAQSHYNSMVNPFAKLGIKGVLWYQGESNANTNADLYSTLLTNLTTDFRTIFNDATLPMLVVQLPRYGSVGLPTNMWAFMREQQKIAVDSMQNAYLAITMDTGDAVSVHCTDKAPVGTRLGLLARNKIYNDVTAISDAPVLTNAVLEADSIVVTLNNLYEGLSGDAIGWFELAGDDMLFAAAEYEIQPDNTIKVFKTGMTSPKYVRYGFKNYFENTGLKSSVGLPVTPFRTDTAAFPY